MARAAMIQGTRAPVGKLRSDPYREPVARSWGVGASCHDGHACSLGAPLLLQTACARFWRVRAAQRSDSRISGALHRADGSRGLQKRLCTSGGPKSGHASDFPTSVPCRMIRLARPSPSAQQGQQCKRPWSSRLSAPWQSRQRSRSGEGTDAVTGARASRPSAPS